MSTFQMIVTGVFITLTLIGVGVFAAFGGLVGNASVGKVAIWGTVDQQTMDAYLQAMRNTDKSFQDVIYTQVSASNYDQSLINAIAAGRAPDLFMLTQEDLGVFGDKVSLIPYSAVSQSTYTNSYLDEASVFQVGQGVLALPMMIDPLVMYYNRDLLSTAGVASAPQTWSDFLVLAPKITALDSSQNVARSAVALGTWDNIAHAKSILSALFMQAGDPIIARTSQGALAPVFGQTPQGAAVNPAASALQFYTEFANPSKTSYSWNRSLPNSAQAFVGGDLAVYFGYASEMGAIAAANPNLHFGVALLPQLSGSSAHLTFGLITGVAVPHGAANPQGALTIAQKMTSQLGIQGVVATFGGASVRRDVGIDTTSSAAAAVFQQSALISRGWFDPSPSATDSIFRTMVPSVTTGAADPGTSVVTASQALQALFQ